MSMSHNDAFDQTVSEYTSSPEQEFRKSTPDHGAAPAYSLESADREIQAHAPEAIPQEREQLDELGFDQLWAKMVKANKPWLR
ncbi:hypothetical protein [Azotobacter beijerinckii]|uniref:Uncharacterized protein n=1 Tax=Azotobacter beijerinckii TaxID=170623 RepID=A0A1I4HX47_9GAMM|nr:hypothetical protein [Azotobacter beijerinckii]SFL46668.1 hypothetical protein SAMN04244574_04394 [Azotobacter beijerinckii]